MKLLRYLLALLLFAAPAAAQVIVSPPTTGGGSGTVVGGACPGAPDQMVTAISDTGVPMCSKVTSAFVDSTVLTSGGAAGTPSSINLANGTALPLATGVSGLGANVAAVLATFSSANLRTATTDESGTGALLFAGGNIGAATGTSLSLSGLGGSGVRCLQTDNVGAISVAAAGCGGSGASTALDNLAAVNINTALLAQTGVDLGSTTKQFRDLFLFGSGTYGSTYIRLTGAPTGARVLTLPNATGTLVYSGGPIDLSGATSATLPIAAIGSLSTGMAAALASMTVANLATALGSQNANCFLASPDGSSGSLSCRTPTYGDLPLAVPITKLTSGTTLAAYGGTYQLNFATPQTLVLPAVAAHPGQGYTFINIAGSSTATIDGNSAETVCDPSGCATTKTIAANAVMTIMADADAGYWRAVSQAVSGGSATTVYPKAPGLRLTTQSGICQSTADRTAQGTMYYTPAGYCGGGSYLALYSGAAWVEFTQAELSLALTATSGKNYDIFACYNSGTPNLALSAAWTNDTTRADALALQDGFPVKSSDHTCLNIGVIRASASNVTEDSEGNSTTQVGGKRFVWNRYVQLPTSFGVVDKTDSWDYASVWRQANGAAGNKVEYVSGEANTVAQCGLLASGLSVSTASIAQSVAIGVDSTSTPSGHYSQYYNGYGIGIVTNESADYRSRPGLGYHYLAWLERGNDGGSSTFFGDDGGMSQNGLICTVQM